MFEIGTKKDFDPLAHVLKLGIELSKYLEKQCKQHLCFYKLTTYNVQLMLISHFHQGIMICLGCFAFTSLFFFFLFFIPLPLPQVCEQLAWVKKGQNTVFS